MIKYRVIEKYEGGAVQYFVQQRFLLFFWNTRQSFSTKEYAIETAMIWYERELKEKTLKNKPEQVVWESEDVK